MHAAHALYRESDIMVKGGKCSIECWPKQPNNGAELVWYGKSWTEKHGDSWVWPCSGTGSRASAIRLLGCAGIKRWIWRISIYYWEKANEKWRWWALHESLWCSVPRKVESATWKWKVWLRPSQHHALLVGYNLYAVYLTPALHTDSLFLGKSIW